MRSRIVIGIVVVGLLSGCAGSPAEDAAGSAAGVTIAQSKSYAQLLRNEASSRLPSIVLKEASESTDAPVACGDAATDPDRLEQSWASSTRILVSNSRAATVQTVTDELVASFVDQDWTATPTAESTDVLQSVDLSSATSLASIQVVTALRTDAQAPSIHIIATGACAVTGGPDSDEVVKLTETG